ncbi:hypothetical protein SG34_032940 [Thalassomonas viridans]|uniref:Uncharacterized protein n=1 Tax=Thalassomonas viridans TaxID=137584 RepID=A0AAF0CCV7_9GAMM|nr:hypothetical protein [Thalassomonas viridans]WDE08713.1 hypothetical protein SG34_032940 [Thalassomonas viridans]
MMEDKFKVCGWAFTIYGIILLSVSIILYVTLINNSLLNVMPFNYMLFTFVFVVGLLTFLCGIYIFKGNPNVHKIALPISVLALINFPIGTVVGGLYLWLRFKNA